MRTAQPGEALREKAWKMLLGVAVVAHGSIRMAQTRSRSR